MQYLLLINRDEDYLPSLSVKEQDAILEEFMALTAELRASGAYVGANQLGPATTAATVQVRDGEQGITDGPFAETKEQLGGYYLIDVASLDEALEWAAKVPAARWGSVEVRPIVPIPVQASA